MSNSHQQVLNIGKVVCVGRNYAEHAKELGNDVPTQPLLFMKPASSVVNVHDEIILPDFGGDTHYEAELCIQVSKDLHKASKEQVMDAISGITLGLDLTLRELQTELKTKGHPWERSKAFAGSCVLADWLPLTANTDFSNIHYQFHINDELKQHGDTALMLFSVVDLLVEISHAFGLQAGDVIMTGTPKGVGVLKSGDVCQLALLDNTWSFTIK